MAKAKVRYVILVAKTDKGKEKINYHGDKWILIDEVENIKFNRQQGPSYVLRSRDGSKVIFIRKENELDFEFRLV